METWRPINGYTNYSVSDKGRVKNNKTGKILSPGFDTNGYRFVMLYKDGKGWHGFLHRLVATAFIPNPNDLPEVNHIDGNKLNCSVSNLEWCTHAQNINHSIKTLGRKHTRREAKRVLCEETGEVFPTVRAAAMSVQRSYMAVWKCLNGWMKTAGGLHWRWLV